MQVVVGQKTKWKRPRGRNGRGSEENIKMPFKNVGVKLRLDSSGSGNGRVAGCFDHGNLGYRIRVIYCSEDLYYYCLVDYDTV
jgi:hypothetical protein